MRLFANDDDSAPSALRAALVIVATVLSMGTGFAQQTIVQWAGGGFTSGSTVTDPSEAFAPPDGLVANFNGANAQHEYTNFGQPSSNVTDYTTAALAALLGGGVTEAIIDQADFIVFETNGNSDVGFESCTWSFDDGFSLAFRTHDHNNPSSSLGGSTALAVQSISASAYSSLFGSSSVAPNTWFQALLFDLPSLDVCSPSFKVTLCAGLLGPSVCIGAGIESPDPDAMGVLYSVCAGTQTTFGDDILGTGFIDGLPQCFSTHFVPIGSFLGFTTSSPGGTFNFAPLYVAANVYACGAVPGGPPMPFVPGQICIGPGFDLLAGGPGPAGLPLVLAPTPGFNLTYGPNPGLAGFCIKIQGIVFSNLAFNGGFATTDCHTFMLE